MPDIGARAVLQHLCEVRARVRAVCSMPDRRLCRRVCSIFDAVVDSTVDQALRRLFQHRHRQSLSRCPRQSRRSRDRLWTAALGLQQMGLRHCVADRLFSTGSARSARALRRSTSSVSATADQHSLSTALRSLETVPVCQRCEALLRLVQLQQRTAAIRHCCSATMLGAKKLPSRRVRAFGSSISAQLCSWLLPLLDGPYVGLRATCEEH